VGKVSGTLQNPRRLERTLPTAKEYQYPLRAAQPENRMMSLLGKWEDLQNESDVEQQLM
jgi:hypothetical protein